MNRPITLQAFCGRLRAYQCLFIGNLSAYQMVGWENVWLSVVTLNPKFSPDPKKTISYSVFMDLACRRRKILMILHSKTSIFIAKNTFSALFGSKQFKFPACGRLTKSQVFLDFSLNPKFFSDFPLNPKFSPETPTPGGVHVLYCTEDFWNWSRIWRV